MVSEENDDRQQPRDGATGQAFDEDALYRVVRTAMKDALLDVIGTILLLGVAVVLVVAGAGGLLSGSPLGVALGSIAAVAGLAIGAVELEWKPPLGEQS